MLEFSPQERHYMLTGEALENARWLVLDDEISGPNHCAVREMNIRRVYARYFNTVGATQCQFQLT